MFSECAFNCSYTNLIPVVESLMVPYLYNLYIGVSIRNKIQIYMKNVYFVFIYVWD